MQKPPAPEPVVVPANRIRELREEHDFGLVDLAAHLGKWPTTISRWERGEVAPSDRDKLRLAALFGTNVPHLMGWDREEQVA